VPLIELAPTVAQVMKPPPGMTTPVVEVNVESPWPEPTPSQVEWRLWACATPPTDMANATPTEAASSPRVGMRFFMLT